MPAAWKGYEFQRLHGMGEVLYDLLLADYPAAACRVYAPVGGHRDLLAYLVRRLLENGANSSFVSVAADPSVPIAAILRRPQDRIGDPRHARNPKHSAAARPLCAGAAQLLRRRVRRPRKPRRAARRNPRRHDAGTRPRRIVNGSVRAGAARVIHSPIDGTGDRPRQRRR